MLASRRGIIVYIEYQSVCPFVGIGSPPPPPPQASVSPLLDPKGGWSNTRLRMRGPNSGKYTESLALFIFCEASYINIHTCTHREETYRTEREFGIWNLDHLVTWGVPNANAYGIPRNFAEFREKSTFKIPRNSAKFRGIPCVFHKILYSAGSEKSPSVDTLLTIPLLN
jgi:hypothetical protein